MVSENQFKDGQSASDESESSDLDFTASHDASQGLEEDGLSMKDATNSMRLVFTLGKKLLLGFGCLIILSLILSYVAITGIQRTNQSWQEAIRVGLETGNLAKDSQLAISQTRRYEQEFLLNYRTMGIPEAKKEYIETRQQHSLESLELALNKLIQVTRSAGLSEQEHKAQEALELSRTYHKDILNLVTVIEKTGHQDTGLVGEMRQSIHEIEEFVKDSNLIQLTATMLEARRHEKDFLLREDIQYAAKHNKTMEDLKRQINESDLELSAREQLLKLAGRYEVTFLSLVQGKEAIREAIIQLNASAFVIESNVKKIDSQGMEIEKKYVEKAMSLATPVRIVIFVTAFLITLIGVLASFFISRGITNSLQLLVESMTDVAEKRDLTKDAPIRTTDEIGLLSCALNTMRRSLVEIIMRIQQAALRVTTSSNEILAAASQQASSSSEQASQISQLQSTFTQQATTATELGQSSQEVAKFAQAAAEVSREGTQLIEDTNAKMKSMNISNEGVANKLKALNEKVEGIGKMLTTILGVADQTNLLSLNAAIEASKAGEQGKGFSVVAQEIRRLADQTAQSSKEISNLINEIQASSSGALMAMEKSSQDVASSTELVNNLSSRFLGINDRVQQILTQVEGMTRGVQEQGAGSKQASMALSQMSEGIRLSAESAKQSRKAASDMTVMSQQLRNAVGQFRLK